MRTAIAGEMLEIGDPVVLNEDGYVRKLNSMAVKVPKELQRLLNLLTGAECTLQLLQSQQLLPLFDDAVFEDLTLKEISILLANRRHKILDQLGTSFDPKDYTELKSTPGLQEFPSVAEKKARKAKLIEAGRIFDGSSYSDTAEEAAEKSFKE